MLNSLSLSLGVAAGCLAALANSTTAAPTVNASLAKITRAKGPAELGVMLARYDAMKPGAARDKLALEIDHFAGQRYATVSRLFWYQNLDDAKAAAASEHRPILHLRMLGRLDEDLSCANSRFFRATLYANADTSKFLRDNFVLLWSSERPVPKVTIDYGDGRKIVRTTTGNSAHYVMDERGNVLDVLPGLYAPVVFRGELQKSLDFAKSVNKLDGDKLLDAAIAFHKRELEASQKQYAALAGTDFIRRRGRLITAAEIGATAVQRSERATYAKAMVEMPDLQKIGIDAGSIDPTDLGTWATVGQKAWSIGLDTTPQRARPLVLLDKQSAALVEQLHQGTALPGSKSLMFERLEQAILADSAHNQFRLRPQIRRQFEGRRTLDFDTLNRVIYDNIFSTPKDDTWLGLLTVSDFTGVPAEGVVMP